MVMYIMIAQPYAAWQLTALELSAHILHAAIMSAGLGLAQAGSNSGDDNNATVMTSSETRTNWFMVAMLVLVVLIVLSFEVWGALRLVRLIWIYVQNWWEERLKQHGSEPEEPCGVEEPSTYMDIAQCGVGSSSRRPPSSDQAELSQMAADPSSAGSQVKPSRTLSGSRLAGADSSSPPQSEWPAWPRIRRDSDDGISITATSDGTLHHQHHVLVSWPRL